MATIEDTCSYAKINKCTENNCHVRLEDSFAVYCAKTLRDHIMEKGKPTIKICDCVITDSHEEKISVVELKNRRGFRKILEGKGKAGHIDPVRRQFKGGLIVLRRMLERIGKPRAHIQLVLYAKTEIQDRSEKKRLRRHLSNGPSNLGITMAICGEKIPADYVAVHVRDIEMRA